MDWKAMYAIPFKHALSTKLRYFQFKVLHNILVVNKYLKLVGILNSDLCDFWLNDIESITHLFWDCPVTHQLILKFQEHTLNNQIILSMNSFLFGISKGNFCHFNFVILYAKYYIFLQSLKMLDYRLNYLRNSWNIITTLNE